MQQAIRAYDSTLYLFRGRAYAALGDAQRAIQDFNKAIELNPQSAVAYFDRGVHYDELGDTQQAIRDYTKAIELNFQQLPNPHACRIFLLRGLAYDKRGNTKLAIDDYIERLGTALLGKASTLNAFEGTHNKTLHRMSQQQCFPKRFLPDSPARRHR